MWQHFLVLIGLVALLVGWVYFQEWLMKVNPKGKNYNPGCGACASKDSCSKQ